MVKFTLFMVVIHLVSLSSEWLLVGQFGLEHATRFIITFNTAAPIVTLTFYSIHRARRLHQRLVMLSTKDALTGI